MEPVFLVPALAGKAVRLLDYIRVNDAVLGGPNLLHRDHGFTDGRQCKGKGLRVTIG